MRKLTVTALCIIAFITAGLSAVLHAAELCGGVPLPDQWGEVFLYSLMGVVPGLSAMLLSVGLVPWLRAWVSMVITGCAGAFAFPAAVWHVYAVIRYDPLMRGVPGLAPATAWSVLGESWFGRGEALGTGPILLILSAAFLVRRISRSPAAGRLWQALWAAALVLALWWPVAVFAGPGDPVVAMGWFVAYGPASLLLVLALPLWQAPSQKRPPCTPAEPPDDGHGRTD